MINKGYDFYGFCGIGVEVRPFMGLFLFLNNLDSWGGKPLLGLL